MLDEALLSLESDQTALFKNGLEDHLLRSFKLKPLKFVDDDVLKITVIEPNPDTILNSKMHSHCFVRMETVYTPIAFEDER
jgi:hypothetical protein